ncbi:MAG TPA: hypothetical protein VK196_13160 [Magnetospirillum sp.]|nr:hypothetical protein [Magnetospirillum sp.]
MSAEARREAKRFKSLVEALFNEGIKYMQTKEGAAYGSINANWFASRDELVSSMRPDTGNFGNKLVPLAPPKDLGPKAIVAMWCKWTFDADYACEIQVMIHREKNQAYGFRIDKPNPRGDLRHGYWHVQFTREFQGGGAFTKATGIDWISTSTPAFPIALDKDGGLLPKDAAIYATISLYGGTYPQDLSDTLKSMTGSESLKSIVLGTTAA